MPALVVPAVVSAGFPISDAGAFLTTLLSGSPDPFLALPGVITFCSDRHSIRRQNRLLSILPNGLLC